MQGTAFARFAERKELKLLPITSGENINVYWQITEVKGKFMHSASPEIRTTGWFQLIIT